MKMKKERKSQGGGGGGVRVVRLGGRGGQGGCERRSEAFVKIQFLFLFFFNWGGRCQVGGGEWGQGGCEWRRMEKNGEVKFL